MKSGDVEDERESKGRYWGFFFARRPRNLQSASSSLRVLGRNRDLQLSTAHVIYEGEEYSVPASLAYELDGAVFDGMTIMPGVIHVQ